MKKLSLAALAAAFVLPVLAQDAPSSPGATFITNAASEIGAYNAPIVALLTTCFAIVMIFVGYKLAKRSVSKA